MVRDGFGYNWGLIIVLFRRIDLVEFTCDVNGIGVDFGGVGVDFGGVGIDLD